MVKQRVIGVVLVKNGIAVQSIGFKKYLPLGKPEIAIEYLNRWGIDEIAVIHIDGCTNHDARPSAQDVERYSKKSLAPLSVGGGLKTINDIKDVIHAGADKVILNRALFHSPELITETGALFGCQSVIVSIDVKTTAGQHHAYYDSGTVHSGTSLAEAAKRAQEFGAGELLLNSIDRDGSQQGYDLSIYDKVKDSVNIPVILCGGAGHPKHMIAALSEGASAVAAGNFFHYNEHSVILVKKYLKDSDCAVRLDSYVNYANLPTDSSGRIARASDEYLDQLRFHYVPEEKI